jgi:hypothetical protein
MHVLWALFEEGEGGEVRARLLEARRVGIGQDAQVALYD